MPRRHAHEQEDPAPLGMTQQDFMTSAFQFLHENMGTVTDMASGSGSGSASSAMSTAHSFFNSLLGASAPPSASQGVFHIVETDPVGNTFCLETDVTPTDAVRSLNITSATPGSCHSDPIDGDWDMLDSAKMRITTKLYQLHA
mmetsp:Transcript_3678/g.10877  ORF Transcript_3678/g.10877 Transcript_3678/m.10877 type:complete len:143 (+) Transcript_3678:42-470(+)